MATEGGVDLEQQGTVDEGAVVFLKSEVDTDNDIWDDSELIKAYDKAVEQARQVNGDLRAPRSKKKKKKNKKSSNSGLKWSAGDSCRAYYSEDGALYDAVITDILPAGKCIVRYVDYGNDEEQLIKDLLKPFRPAGHMRAAPKEEVLPSGRSSVSCSACSSRQSSGKENPTSRGKHYEAPSFIPPPPPSLSTLPACGTDEAFHSMLISWYMSGFHTGYYQGLKDGKQEAKAHHSVLK